MEIKYVRSYMIAEEQIDAFIVEHEMENTPVNRTVAGKVLADALFNNQLNRAELKVNDFKKQ